MYTPPLLRCTQPLVGVVGCSRCERFDLLNKLYQACGEWDKALEVAEQHDRIHLRTTFYNYAKHLESLGDVPAAMAAYEKSHTHRQEIPRMLYESQQLIELERYIMCAPVKAQTRPGQQGWLHVHQLRIVVVVAPSGSALHPARECRL